MAYGRGWVRVATIGAVSLVMLVAVACTPPPAPGEWTALEVPANGFDPGEPPAARADQLSQVSCVELQPYGRGAGNAWCVAVGSGRMGGVPQSLVTVWDGTAWQVTSRPGPVGDEVRLTDVACPAVRRCVAVGERWDGTVSVVRTGDGTTWQDVDLSGIAGRYGHVWSVSCSGPAFCLATGSGTLVLQGTAWRAGPPPGGPLSVSELSCLSPTRCLAHAAGPRGPETFMVWNGVGWAGTPLLVDGRSVYASRALACSPGLTCHALGQVQDLGGRAPAFVAGDGVYLATTTAPDPARSADVMACDRTGGCLAVSPPAQAWRWTGTAWSPAAPPTRAPSGSARGLACVPGWCVLVGAAPAPGGGSGSVPYAEGYSY